MNLPSLAEPFAGIGQNLDTLRRLLAGRAQSISKLMCQLVAVAYAISDHVHRILSRCDGGEEHKRQREQHDTMEARHGANMTKSRSIICVCRMKFAQGQAREWLTEGTESAIEREDCVFLSP